MQKEKSFQMENNTTPRLIPAINWNKVEDPKDLEVWNRMTSNFWLPERVPLSNDMMSWGTLTDLEKRKTMEVFAGLTLLDTVQSQVGALSMKPDVLTPHEDANLEFIAAMEAIHAKSYSSIFSTLCSSEEIDDLFRWTGENPLLIKKQTIVLSYYDGKCPLMRKVASVLLESFLFYSGFYLPFYWSSRGKMTNTADMIRLILSDEGVHGHYIGYKFQLAFKELTPERQEEIRDKAYSLLMELYENEIEYTRSIYDDLGMTEDVTSYLHYNANKALMNMGFDPIFPPEICKVNPAVMASLVPAGDETHDFFSGGGSAYAMLRVEPTTDADWAGWRGN